MSDIECDCELRNRAWNLNTGECQTCRRSFPSPAITFGTATGPSTVAHPAPPAACSPRFVLAQGTPQLIEGCACGATFDPLIDDTVWLEHADQAGRADREIARYRSLQWVREVSAPQHVTTMPSLPVRLGVIHDELLRAALAWAQADRAADVAADKINGLEAERDALVATIDSLEDARKATDLYNRERHASIALDIAGAAEQKADEALRAIAKRLLAELGI